MPRPKFSVNRQFLIKKGSKGVKSYFSHYRCFFLCLIFSENGDLVYPYTKLEDLIKCDIEVELLLNSYNGALPKQVVVLHFEGVKSFHFFQEHTFDYSEIYEVTFCVLEVNKFEFIFHVRPGSIFHVRPGSELIDTLKIVCTKMICKEL